jgi:hypothetical protein
MAPADTRSEQSASGRESHLAHARRHLLLLLTLALLVVGRRHRASGPWGVDEERFLGVALEMLQTAPGWCSTGRRAVFRQAAAVRVACWRWPRTSRARRACLPAAWSHRRPGLHGLCLRSRASTVEPRAGLAAGLLFLATVQTCSSCEAGKRCHLRPATLASTASPPPDGRPHPGWYAVRRGPRLGILCEGGASCRSFCRPDVHGHRREFRVYAPIARAIRAGRSGPRARHRDAWAGPLLVRAAVAHDPRSTRHRHGSLRGRPSGHGRDQRAARCTWSTAARRPPAAQASRAASLPIPLDATRLGAPWPRE